MQIHQNREGDLLDEQDTNRQAGLNIESKENLLTVLVISRQAGQVTK